MAKDINIGGRLHSIATGNVVAGTDEILDDNLGKKQTQINTETYSLVESVNNALAELSPDQQEALGVAAKANANEAKLGYYVCDTDADVAAKTVVATNYVLGVGGSIKVKMTNANTANNATLNINSTDAKPLFYEGVRASSTNTWAADDVLEIYYDGTNYQAKNISPTFKTGEKVNSVGVDDEPTANSNNLVKSGGVSKEFTSREDISINNDFEISDENNYSILKIKRGHIITKEFDSSKKATTTNSGLMSAEDKIVVDNAPTINEGVNDFEISDENNYSILKIKGGHIITKKFDSSKQERIVDGIIPKGDTIINPYISSTTPTGYITTHGICTQRNEKMLADCIITSLHFYANKNGRLHFGVGLIDQRDWAIIVTEFDVDCVEGINDVDIAQKCIIGIRKGVLFVFNNYYGDGVSVGYINKKNKTENEYIYSDTIEGALSSVSGNGANLALSYTQDSKTGIYDYRAVAEKGREEIDEIINKVAYSHNSYHEILGEDGQLYKLSINSNGAVAANVVNYRKITIFGNSTWSHSTLKSYLPDVADEEGTWKYEPYTDSDFGMDSRGMAATLQDFDFKHLFRRGMREKYPNCIVQGKNIAGIERTLPQSIYNSFSVTERNTLLANDVDVIIWRAGENVSNINDYADALRRYILEFKQYCPNAKIIFTGRFWLNRESDNAVKEVCEEFNLPYIKLYKNDIELYAKRNTIMKYQVKNTSTLNTKESYYITSSGAGHPSNLGMLYIANKLLLALNQMPLLITHKVIVTNNTEATCEYFTKAIEGEFYSFICESENVSITVNDSEGNSIETMEFTNADDVGLLPGYTVVSFIVPNNNIIITVNSL